MDGRRMKRMLLSLGFVGLVGCATSGELVTLDVRTGAGPAGSGDGLRAAVTGFADARAATGRIGVRHHLWGGKTEFTVPGDQPGAVVAGVLADTLKRQGWRVAQADGSDVMFTGKVLAFTVAAESQAFRTDITVKTQVVVEGRNAGDGSVVRITVNGEGVQQVFWFEPEDARDLLKAVLTESLEKGVRQTKVDKNLLRLK